MEILFIILLILFGLGLILIEIIFLPGLITGIIGFIMCGAGIFWMYSSQGSPAGNITLLSSITLALVMSIFVFKSRAWNRFSLKDQLRGKSSDLTSLSLQVGDMGQTLSALRPSGTVLINNQKVEATSNGEFIDAHQNIEITKVLTNKILVKRKT